MALTEKEAFKYCMICGSEFHTNSEIEKECPSCGYIYFIAAKPGSACLILNDDRQLLLIKRKRNPYKDTWDIPAGFMEFNETFEECLLREVREEVGINLVNYKYYKSILNDYEFKGIVKKSLSAVFISEIGKNIVVKPGDDAADCKFVDIETFDVNKIGFIEVRKLITDFKEFKRSGELAKFLNQFEL